MVYTSKESKPAKPTERVTLWDKEGNARTYNTLDAKEILAMPNTLYSRAPLAPKPVVVEAEQKPVESVAVVEEVKEEAVVEAPHKKSKKDE